jgi:hypothetical protein
MSQHSLTDKKKVLQQVGVKLYIFSVAAGKMSDMKHVNLFLSLAITCCRLGSDNMPVPWKRWAG